MSLLTIALYIAAFGLWWYVLAREDGIGIGVRFLFAANFAMFFLVGPVVGELFEPVGDTWLAETRDRAYLLTACGFLAYLIGAYFVFPSLVGRSRLIPNNFARRMADPVRLDAQWKVAWVLIVMGFVGLAFYQLAQSIPTFGAVVCQMPLLIDTGLVMLCLNGAFSGRPASLAAMVGVLGTKAVVYAAFSGHAGSTFLIGIFLVCIFFLSRKLRARQLVLLLIVAILAFIPAQNWMKGRDKLRGAIKDGVDYHRRVELTVDILTDTSFFTGDEEHNLVATYQDRGDFSRLFVAAVAHTPAKEPYGEGITYLDMIYAVVPRFSGRKSRSRQAAASS